MTNHFTNAKFLRNPFNLVLAVVALLQLPASAAEKQKFNPDEALGFLESLSTIDLRKPDPNLLAKLFMARKGVGLGDDFVRGVEGLVASGMLITNRVDLYLKHVKPECGALKIDEFEKSIKTKCPDCDGGYVIGTCEKCQGSGKCVSCKGNGFIGTPVLDLEGNYRAAQCSSCAGTRRCANCDGSGKTRIKCKTCKGRGGKVDKQKVEKAFSDFTMATLQALCDLGDREEMPDVLKRGFANARETAESKFGKVFRERRLEQERREEEDRREQAERERRESVQRELEGKRPEIERKAADMARQRANEFLTAIYNGENLFAYFISNSSYDLFMADIPFGNTTKYWTLRDRVLLGTPIDTSLTGKPMAVVRVDYLGQVHDIVMQFSSVTSKWHVRSADKMPNGGLGSGYNWKQMPLEQFYFLLDK